jgi:transposase
MLTRGPQSARVVRRTSILRQLGSGQKAAQMATNLGAAAKTGRPVARRYEEQELHFAVYEKGRPSNPRALDMANGSVDDSHFALARATN